MGYLEVQKRNGEVDRYPKGSFLTLYQAEHALGVSSPTLKKHAMEEGLLKPLPYHIMLSDFLRLIRLLADKRNQQTGAPYWPWLGEKLMINSEGLASLIITPPERRVVFTKRTIYYFRPAPNLKEIPMLQ